MQLETIEPHGFCAGVRGAIDKAFSLPAGAYCLHEIVHNEIVTAELKNRGVKFAECLDEVPDGAVLLFSAHGVSPLVRHEAQKRNMKIVDATCPFVQKVHASAVEFARQGLDVVVIGDEAHVEVAGIMGAVESAGKSKAVAVKSENEFSKLGVLSSNEIGVVSQTTMNRDDVSRMVDLLGRRYKISSVAQVCSATNERQSAVKRFKGDALVVLGSANSSNTARLCEIFNGKKVYRVATMEELKRIDFSGVRFLGLTSGASTPESFFDEAKDYLKGLDE